MEIPDSFYLKVDRAEKHLDELQEAVDRYSQRQACDGRLDFSPRDDAAVVRGWVRQKPPQEIPIILGDMFHNLRSALDHLAVSTVEPKYRYDCALPIETEPIWSEDSATGRMLPKYSDRRWAYARKTTGMPTHVQYVVDKLQPWRWDEPLAHAITLVGRINNADKHRRLTEVAQGMVDPEITLTLNGRVIHRDSYTGVLPDGGTASLFGLRASSLGDRVSNVTVDLTASLTVQFRIGGFPGTYPISELLTAVKAVRDMGEVFATIDLNWTWGDRWHPPKPYPQMEVEPGS